MKSTLTNRSETDIIKHAFSWILDIKDIDYSEQDLKELTRNHLKYIVNEQIRKTSYCTLHSKKEDCSYRNKDVDNCNECSYKIDV